MSCWDTNCNLFNKKIVKSSFNLSCHCARCQRSHSECASCKEYNKKIASQNPTKEQAKNIQNCFYCLNCNTGR